VYSVVNAGSADIVRWWSSCRLYNDKIPRPFCLS